MGSAGGMIVDSSALIAILTSEPEREILLRLMAAAPVRRFSAASLLETRIVLNRLVSNSGAALLEVSRAGRDRCCADDRESGAQRLSGLSPFRQRDGDAAQLNILDCCAYALAAEFAEPLLFKGGDFGKTDLAVASDWAGNS